MTDCTGSCKSNYHTITTRTARSKNKDWSARNQGSWFCLFLRLFFLNLEFYHSIIQGPSWRWSGADTGGAPGALPPPPLKLENIWFFGVKSWFFTRNTPKIFAPPSARRNFFKSAPLTWNPGFAPGDRMLVGFTTTYAISVYHHWCCEFESRSGRGVQHYVIKVCQWFATGRWFSQGPLVSSTNKTDRHDI